MLDKSEAVLMCLKYLLKDMFQLYLHYSSAKIHEQILHTVS